MQSCLKAGARPDRDAVAAPGAEVKIGTVRSFAKALAKTSAQLHFAVASRRGFLALAGFVLAHPGIALARSEDDAPSRQRVIRVVIDRLLPAHGAHPGARALGVDLEVLQLFQARRRGRLLLRAMHRALDGDAFLELSPAEQDARIAGLLADHATTAPFFRTLLHHATSAYFVKPESWTPFGYTTPQPRGYPDYGTGRCDAG
jgi:hypothetical protein